MRQNSLAVACGLMMAVVSGSAPSGAQIRRQPPVPVEQQGTAIQASLNAAGERYQSSAPGKCTHAPTASIYGVVSELWTVQQSDNGKSLTLSLWQPKDGTRSMVSLTIAAGKSYRVSTVKGGETIGSAKVSMEPSGKGGTFTVYAKSADGADIMGTIKCEAFAPHIAEGGL
jgi:hypothetical protein